MADEWNELFGRPLGTTSKQILDAPLAALYVVERQDGVHYAQRLADHLGRSDIKAYSMQALLREPQNILAGRRIVVVDHAATREMRGLHDLDRWREVAQMLRARGLLRETP